MAYQYLLRRDFLDIEPFLPAIRMHADNERNALGFLPEPAYAEAARQRKLILLVVTDSQTGTAEYAGHLLFGGIFPTLKVRQICISPKYRRTGQATTLLRALKAQGEAEGYFSIVANVASDLQAANQFYEKNGFSTLRLKAGGATRNRTINVRTLQLETASLLSLMAATPQPKLVTLHSVNKRSQDASLYAIDLNVFFDVIRDRPRSHDAGVLFGAALRQHIRIAASDEFIRELERKSYDRTNDPTLSLAKQIPNLPPQDKTIIESLIPDVSAAVFPERTRQRTLGPNDKSDVLHLCHAIAAGAAGYITSDSRVLSARDALMSAFGMDIIGLSEFAELLDLPTSSPSDVKIATRHFRVDNPAVEKIEAFLEEESENLKSYLQGSTVSACERICLSDEDGIIGVGLLLTARAIESASRSFVCVRQEHAFSSTAVDFLISEQIRSCSKASVFRVDFYDIPHHPITRRIALSHGFQQRKGTPSLLTKIAIGRPATKKSWTQTRLAVERLTGLKLQEKCPTYDTATAEITSDGGTRSLLPIFELETLLSPTVLALPKRAAVIVPIAASYASLLLGTDTQYTFLDVPEAQFLSRRTYFNTVRAAHAMIRGGVICFYESMKGKGRGAIVAIGRIVDVTSVPAESVPEIMQRAAVVDDPSTLTKSDRVLATSFDNLMALRNPVPLRRLREIGCADGSNFVSATPISAEQLEEIVSSGFPDD
ncbi:MAG: GNAT family N-acetyltransferase [Pseudorhodoplanes sp.]|nr:GNAT family N-acetyltransferase [Pseudorhodoplanes sp.]